jgi:hypothetical protein
VEVSIVNLSAFLKNRYLGTAVAGAACLAACGCGGSAASRSGHSSPASVTTPQATSDWVDRANQICRSALPDSSHELVNHFDVAHIKHHGMAVIEAGSNLDALGAPSDTDLKSYADMLDLYRRSAIDHGLAVREIEKGDAGNAAVYYSIGLDLADKADAIAAGFGATDCTRFGMGR